MKALFWIGIVVLILGIASLVEGCKAGGLSVGIETQHQEKVSPIVSAAMILCGAGLLIAGKRKS